MKTFAGASRQRGAIAMMTAVFLIFALLCLVLVVDTGRLYYEKRSLQRIADSSALDAATEGGLCSLDSGPGLESLAAVSASRNGFTGNISAAPNAVSGGYMETVDGIRVFNEDASRIEAVQVVLGKDVPASIVAGGLFGGIVPLRVQATAQRIPSITFSAGSALLNVSSAESALLNPLLNGLLGSNLNLNAVAYQGIANADVSLLDFMRTAGLIGTRITAGAVDQALNTSISLANFSTATVNVLDQKQVAGVGLLSNQLLGVKNLTLKLSDIVAVDSAPGMLEEALKANVNLLELLMAAAMAANKNNAVALNLGVAGVTASLRVIEPPVIGIGWPGMENGNWRTKAKTAQVRLIVGAAPNLLGLVGGNIGLTAEVAQGEAWFEQARCRTLATGSTDIDMEGKTGLASVKLTNASGTGDAEIKVGLGGSGSGGGLGGLFGGGLSILTAEVGLDTTIGASNIQDIDYNIVNKKEDLPEMKTMASGNGLATSIQKLHVHLTAGPIGLDLDPLTNVVKGIVVDGVVNDLVNPVVIPLLSLLGVQPGVMDVQLQDIREGPAILQR
ncbi:MAG: pilus assembly protein TadG-related protein [Pedobacter sp.]|nr:pilus assembly protein TadG-related protein [Pedobacter sp.]